jgi:hypothetical protein
MHVSPPLLGFDSEDWPVIFGNPEVIRGMSGKSEHCRRKAILSKHSSLRELRRSQAAASV